MNELPKLFREFLELINVKGIEAMGIKVFAATTIFLAAYGVSRIVQRFIDRRLNQDSYNDEVTIRIYKSIARYVVMVPGILLFMHNKLTTSLG